LNITKEDFNNYDPAISFQLEGLTISDNVFANSDCMFEIFDLNYTYKDMIFNNNGNLNSSNFQYLTEAIMCF